MRLLALAVLLAASVAQAADQPWWATPRNQTAITLALASMSTTSPEVEQSRSLPEIPKVKKPVKAPRADSPTRTARVQRLAGPVWKLNRNGTLAIPPRDYLYDRLVNTHSMNPQHLEGLTHRDLLNVHDNVRNHGRTNLFLPKEEPAIPEAQSFQPMYYMPEPSNCADGNCSSCAGGACSRRRGWR